MSYVGSPTRRYRVETEKGFCCAREHRTIVAARKCAGQRGALIAIDWAFGLRAEVPTFGAEWREDAEIRSTLRKQEARP